MEQVKKKKKKSHTNKGRSRNRSCESKKKHASEGAAKSAIYSMKSRGDGIGMLGAYSCVYCGGWHVGQVGDPKSRPYTRYARLVNKIDKALMKDKKKRIEHATD